MADETHQLQSESASPKNEAISGLHTEETAGQSVVTAAQNSAQYQRLSPGMRILLVMLALALLGAGMGFLVSDSVLHYHGMLNRAATVDAQATQHGVSTAQAHGQATADAMSTAQANSQATATSAAVSATADVYTTLFSQTTQSDPIFSDPLSDDSGQGSWDEGYSGDAPDTGCVFIDNAYHAEGTLNNSLQACLARATGFGDFVYQVTMILNKGGQGQAGIIFRANPDENNYYFFHLGADGTYALDLYKSGEQASQLLSGQSNVIGLGLGQSNRLAVLTRDNELLLYINEQYISTVTDSSLTSGRIGVGVLVANTPIDASFSDAKVWQTQG